MSLAFFTVTVLLGSSLVGAFVIQPPKQDPQPGPTVALGSAHHRCHMDALPSIRRSLLGALNLQAEPQLPKGQLAAIREQFKNTFRAIGQPSMGTTGSALSDNSPVVAPGVGNTTHLKCCQLASQISLEDLGWDNWVIYPESFTVVWCTPCDPNNVRCPAHPPTAVHHIPSQCCEPTSEETVPIVYMDQLSSLVISSAALTRTCGCGPGNQVPNKE
ncbi:hypothetical protein NHX12_027193 [Muraenolepis orangiensis]|uniref:TGF-beta family profile domain-containing protein n=1 Tax=Muraenolepis orangiensis TaxID=630683 RepID=A0A9Q0INY5_9TELE|nr:hypothetical protein NHX12_027193 [Muraenolepis orangiensis]